MTAKAHYGQVRCAINAISLGLISPKLAFFAVPHFAATRLPLISNNHAGKLEIIIEMMLNGLATANTHAERWRSQFMRAGDLAWKFSVLKFAENSSEPLKRLSEYQNIQNVQRTHNVK